MRRRSRGPLPRRLLSPDVASSLEPTADQVTNVNAQIQELASSRKLVAALQHAQKTKMHNRYQSLRNEAAMTEMDYSYTDGFLPGVFFYKYLASVADIGCGNDAAAVPEADSAMVLKSVSHAKLQLQCWLPDTIVFGGNFPPVWLYSDKHGYVRKVINFHESHVMDKLGSRKFENDPVVVFKEPVVTKTLDGVRSSGNNIKLYSTLELKSALTKAVGSPVMFALQKYIKPKGAKAFIVRAVFRAGRPPCGWMINNMAMFDSPNLSILHRFCTMTAVDDSCTFAKLTERACTSVMEVNQRVVHYLERALRLSFESLVADYVKDDLGQWWLAQVKCFRLRSVHLRRMGLSAKLRDAYDRSTVQDEFGHDETTEPTASLWKAKKKAEQNEAAWKLHKMVPCKFCQVLYYQHEVAYKMTMKMMHETIGRIRLRAGTADSPLSFLFQIKDDLDSGLLYQSWNVCNLCYALYERDQALLKVETTFNAFLGCPAKTMKDGGVTIIHEANVARSQPLLPQVPTEFTLCRLMLFFTALYDIPKELYDTETAPCEDLQRQKRSRLFLRFSVLGFDCFVPLDASAMLASTGGDDKKKCYWIPLNVMRCFHFFAPKTPLHGKLRETSGLGAYLEDESKITIQLIRCTDPHKVDIDPYRTHHHQQPPHSRRHHALFNAGSSSYAVLLGSTPVQLFQFRSSYVSKTDVYTSMSAGELFNLKANVGFERIRIVQSKHITSRYNLRQYFGVFVPDTSFCSSDKLCPEWVDTMNAVSDDPSLIVPQAKLDHFRFRRKSRRGSNSITSHHSAASLGHHSDEELEELVQETSRKQTAPPSPPRKPTTIVLPQPRASREDDGETAARILQDLLVDNAETPDAEDLALTPSEATPLGLTMPPTWCLSVLLHRTHNWRPAEGSSGWTARVSMLGTEFTALEVANERTIVNDDVVFDSIHKTYFRGHEATLEALHMSKSCTVRLVHDAATGHAYVVNIEMTGLSKHCRTCDGTFVIQDENTPHTSDNAPYLSASVSIVPLSARDASLLTEERGYVAIRAAIDATNEVVVFHQAM
ncbi:hypothetical protein LEN26_017490 [Aphanomyces euteiches]|nr:hypothetical protein LEN26_017490 [Aphanomyces euteiches]KAH9184770.1 hypothetical protein AeNC1_013253 [Aphanomyces euteiches]